jgi:hypothetical protein
MSEDEICATIEGVNATEDHTTAVWVLWSSHDICTATEYDAENSTVTKVSKALYYDCPDDEAEFPEDNAGRVSIGRSLMTKYADEIRRLSATTAELDAVQMYDMLREDGSILVEGSVFPAIPEDILSQYPYALIIKQTATVNDTTGVRYTLHVSKSIYAHIAKGIMPGDYSTFEWIGTANIAKVAINYSNTATVWGNWVDHPSGSGLYVYGEYQDDGQNFKETIIWANHDIMEATSVDMNTGAYTLGDLYYAARQKFNLACLPRIPDDAKQYSNYLLCAMIGVNEELKGVNGLLIAYDGDALVAKSNEPIDPEMPEILPSFLYLPAPVTIYEPHTNNAYWRYDSSKTDAGYVQFPFPLLEMEMDGHYMKLGVYWSTNTVYEATLDESGQPVNTGIPHYPKRSEVDGIKIGDAVLPPIPEDVKEKFPYISIVSVDDPSGPTMYAMLGAKLKTVFVPKEMSGTAADCDGGLYTEQLCLAQMFVCMENEWMYGPETDNDAPITHIGGATTMKLVWSNYDIYTATALDSVTLAPTAGPELYFSERQNFNGTWLPKIPAGALTNNPNATIVRHDDGDTVNYYLYTLANKFNYFSAEVWNPTLGPYIQMLPDGAGVLMNNAENGESMANIYMLTEDTVNWRYDRTSDAAPPVGQHENGFYEIVWSNFDIYEVVAFDMNTGESSLNESVYFPPQLIDTDRVSIGYNLFDGIVKEIQRLSKTTKKMNALVAYKKLKTV